jgi:hypothetical protein
LPPNIEGATDGGDAAATLDPECERRASVGNYVHHPKEAVIRHSRSVPQVITA